MSDDAPQDVPPPGQNPPPPGSPYPPSHGSAYPPAPGPYPPQYGGGYPPPPGQYPPPGYGYTAHPQQAPKHPHAITSMVLGIIGMTGFVSCGALFLLSPFAWVVGAKSVKAIDANPGVYGGRGEANAGKILGIIGTVCLILVVLFWAGMIALGVASGFDNDYGSYESTSQGV
jgi:hypothetical protein